MTTITTHTGHRSRDTQDPRARVGSTSGHSHQVTDAQPPSAVTGTLPPTPAKVVPVPKTDPPGWGNLADPFLALAAAQVDDLERARIAAENRLRQMTREGIDADGNERGLGMDATHPDVARLAAIVASLAGIEHDAILALQRAMRRHGLGPWVKATIGVGEKQGARLLAAIGDPCWNDTAGKPRTVSALWAYSGLHCLPSDNRDPGQRSPDAQQSLAWVAAKRRKGVKSNWSADAKMRAHLVAESCIKQAKSPYRVTYDARRTHTAVTHSDWSPGHSHNDALRIVSKAVLRDLWRAARAWHVEHDPTITHPGHTGHGTHRMRAGVGPVSGPSQTRRDTLHPTAGTGTLQVAS